MAGKDPALPAGVLTLLRTGSPQAPGRLTVAGAHLQHAMTHLNSAARRAAPAGNAVELEELRSMVVALNDLLVHVTALGRRVPAMDELTTVVAQKCPSPVSIRNDEPAAAGARAAGSA